MHNTHSTHTTPTYSFERLDQSAQTVWADVLGHDLVGQVALDGLGLKQLGGDPLHALLLRHRPKQLLLVDRLKIGQGRVKVTWLQDSRDALQQLVDGERQHVQLKRKRKRTEV